MSYNESYNLRADDDETAAELSRHNAGGPGHVVAFGGKTKSNGSYPVTANVFYRVDVYFVTGDEIEGSPGILTADDGTTYVLAYNYGNAVPTEGAEVLVVYVPNRYVFGFSTP